MCKDSTKSENPRPGRPKTPSHAPWEERILENFQGFAFFRRTPAAFYLSCLVIGRPVEVRRSMR